MTLSTVQIKDLREKTGAGMMDCKKALTETNGDIEAAIDWLRTKGLAAAAKKAGRTAAEGLIALCVKGSKAAMVEVNAETDFVARNEQFQELAEQIAVSAVAAGSDVEKIKASSCSLGGTVEESITRAISTIGENMQLRRAAVLDGSKGFIATYVHNAVKPNLGKIGVLLAIETDKPNDAKVQEIGKQVAMHIAAAKPEALTREGVDASLLERERQVYKEQAMESGKSAEIAEKMVEGRIRKFYEEVVLPEQVFVIDGKAKVSEALDAAAKAAGAKIALVDFALFVLGEGIEKEQSDFAAEVAAAAGL